LLLDAGQLDIGSIAAGEALGIDAHFFAFKARGKTDEGHNDVGFFGGFDGLVLKEILRRCPLKCQARTGDAAGLDIVSAKGMTKCWIAP
jgi:hypothetical protein